MSESASIFFHLATSATIAFAKASCEEYSGTLPIFSKRSLISGSAITSEKALCSRSTTGLGVLGGATIACQISTTAGTPCSVNVGTFSNRLGDAAPSVMTRSRKEIHSGPGMNIKSTCPPSTAWAAGAAP